MGQLFGFKFRSAQNEDRSAQNKDRSAQNEYCSAQNGHRSVQNKNLSAYSQYLLQKIMIFVVFLVSKCSLSTCIGDCNFQWNCMLSFGSSDLDFVTTIQ